MTTNSSPERIERSIEETRAEIGETLSALEHKFSPGQVVDAAAYYFRGSAGEFAGNLGRAVRDNPVPVALLGIGLGWLMFGGSRRRRGEVEPYEYESYEMIGDPYPPTTHGYVGARGTGTYGSPAAAYGSGDGMTEEEASGDGVKARAQETAQAVRDKAADVRHAAEDLAGEARARVSQAQAGVQDAASRARHGAARAGAKAQAGVQEAASRVRHGAAQAGAGARHQAERAREGFTRLLHEQPLVLGAVGLAIGAAIGAALPSTRREDELVGPSRDRLKQRAAETVQVQLERAEKAAAGAADAARDEAHRQGLDVEGGKAAVDELIHKGERVVAAAKSGAKAEAKQASAGRSRRDPLD